MWDKQFLNIEQGWKICNCTCFENITPYTTNFLKTNYFYYWFQNKT